jgi:hypothetical protein
LGRCAVDLRKETENSSVTHELNIDELGDEQANQDCPKEIPKDSERHTHLFERTRC